MKAFRYKPFDFVVPCISQGLQVSPEAILKFFHDGRRCSPLVEALMVEHYGFVQPEKESVYGDLKDSEGGWWEVKSMTNLLQFCASEMVGKNRNFNLERFLRDIRFLKGFLVADAFSFPNLVIYSIPSSMVEGWYFSGKLSKRHAQAGRAKALKLLRSACQSSGAEQLVS